MDKRLYRGLQAMYERMKRRPKIGRYVGREFRDTNGILQGCPLSVTLLNILMTVPSIQPTPVVLNESFVDDLGEVVHDSEGTVHHTASLVLVAREHMFCMPANSVIRRVSPFVSTMSSRGCWPSKNVDTMMS